MKQYEALWYSGGPTYAPNRCIGRTFFRAKDEDEAIKHACLMLMENHPDTDLAKGFYVREVKP